MSPENFFYWLQGYFELRGPAAPLTAEQATKVEAHAGLVASELRGEPLCRVLFLAELIAEDPREYAESFTPKIEEIVGDVFEHVIDPKAGGPEEQERLNNIHGAGYVPPSGRVNRC